MKDDDLLGRLGHRIRLARAARGWTRRDVSERSGVSVRFLVQLESGQANISVRRLADVARALDTSAAALLTDDASEPKVVALLGPRGAGKTTIGRRLARRWHVPFVELDRRIEQASDLTLAQLFSLHGEEYYRRLERETLADVLAGRQSMVLATGGGIVAAPDAFALLRRSATTIWLRASAEDHWKRVVAQGDRRPMADHPQAMADLRALLAARQPLYASADHTVETTGRRVDAVVREIGELVNW